MDSGLKVYSFVFIVFILSSCTNNDKNAHVNMGFLYNEFAMKTDLENEYTKIATDRKQYIDSLYESTLEQKKQLSALPVEQRENALQAYTITEDAFNKQVKEIEEKNQKLVNDMKQQILKRINMYVAEFGEKHGYSYILANQGTGVLMFADSAKDISNDVLQYMNLQYSGSNHE